MCAAPHLLLRKTGKPSFYQVDPGGAGRREVHVKARASHQPGADGRGLVSAVVVEDQMNIQRGRHTLINGIEELAKLRTAVPAVTFSNDRTGLHIEGRKQRCRAVTLVVMASAFRLPRAHRQQG